MSPLEGSESRTPLIETASYARVDLQVATLSQVGAGSQVQIGTGSQVGTGSQMGTRSLVGGRWQSWNEGKQGTGSSDRYCGSDLRTPHACKEKITNLQCPILLAHDT